MEFRGHPRPLMRTGGSVRNVTQTMSPFAPFCPLSSPFAPMSQSPFFKSRNSKMLRLLPLPCFSRLHWFHSISYNRMDAVEKMLCGKEVPDKRVCIDLGEFWRCKSLNDLTLGHHFNMSLKVQNHSDDLGARDNTYN